MIKVKILEGYNKDEEGFIAGFVVKEDVNTYAIVGIDGEFVEYELDELEIIE